MVNRITDFFKPFIVPKGRIPDHSTIEEEIVVKSPTKHPRSNVTTSKHVQKTTSPARKSTTPRRSPQKRSAASSFHDSDDSLYHSSPSPSKQRSLMAVTIPSPSPKRMMSPPPKVERAAAPSRAVNSSFANGSFMSSQSSSRRVMAKDGLQAVTNSDSASADSSDEELADLKTFIPRKKIRLTPPSEAKTMPRVEDTVRPARQSKRLSDEYKRNASPRLPPSPPRTEYKHSLLAMVKAKEKQKQRESRIAAIEAEVKAAEERRQEEAALEAATRLDAGTLAKELAEDSDGVERMQAAMERTEALRDEVQFHFFVAQTTKRKDEPFPSRAFTGQEDDFGFEDDYAREQACLAGFMAEVASDGRLGSEAVGWLARQLARETREELCEAYVEIIRQATNAGIKAPSEWPSLRNIYTTSAHGAPRPSTPTAAVAPEQGANAASLVPSSSLRRSEDVILCVCGSEEHDESLVSCEQCETWQHTTCYYPECDGERLPSKLKHLCVSCKPRKLDVAAARERLEESLVEIAPGAGSERVSESVAPGLLYVVQVLPCLQAGEGVQGVAQAVVDLAFANIDDNVRQDLDVQIAVQDAIESLLDGLSPKELGKVCEYAIARIFGAEDAKHTDDVLRCRLVSSLPATTGNGHQLRRQLALYLITGKTVRPELPLTSDLWFGRLAESLSTRPEWKISHNTDYARIEALVPVLDIAIDAGFSDFSFLHENETPAESTTNSGLLALGPTIDKPSKGERTFNKYIDGLASQISQLASRIMQAGAAHMSRMAPKALLEQLAARLECAVRTRPAPRKDVFARGGFSMPGGAQRSFAGFAAAGGGKASKKRLREEAPVVAQAMKSMPALLPPVQEAGTPSSGLSSPPPSQPIQRTLFSAQESKPPADVSATAKPAEDAAPSPEGPWPDGMGGVVDPDGNATSPGPSTPFEVGDADGMQAMDGAALQVDGVDERMIDGVDGSMAAESVEAVGGLDGASDERRNWLKAIKLREKRRNSAWDKDFGTSVRL